MQRDVQLAIVDQSLGLDGDLRHAHRQRPGAPDLVTRLLQGLSLLLHQQSRRGVASQQRVPASLAQPLHGAQVGQQPFGGARASGTNDKAGSMMNLYRWLSARTIKETFNPPTDYRYPFMAE